MSTARWVCPYCKHTQIYTEKNAQSTGEVLWIRDRKTSLYPKTFGVVCLNDECGRISLRLTVYHLDPAGGQGPGKQIQSWNIWPESASKPQPNFVPKPLRDDYYEACLIRDKSPKSSATLARRCLQGMIRDFCNIQKGTLNDEIKMLRKHLDEGVAPAGVSPESIDGIDAVRSIGNIGAHMEKDINFIVEVDPGEAQILIELIETLFEDWYVARHVRAERFAKVKSIAADKKAQISDAKMTVAPPPSE